MPTFRHGRNTALLVAGNDVAAYFREATLTQGVDLAETSTFGTFDKTYVVGMRGGTLSLGGLWDGTTGAIDEILSGVLGVDAPVAVTYLPEGAGGRAYQFNAEETNYEVSAAYNDVVAITADFTSTGGIGAGSNLTAQAAATAGGNSASVDNGASSAFGATATLHVTTNTRNGALVGKVQHSPDNAAWSDLVTFTSIGSALTGSERIDTGVVTVNRYLRALWTLGGSTGSTKFYISAARKNN